MLSITVFNMFWKLVYNREIVWTTDLQCSENWFITEIYFEQLIQIWKSLYNKAIWWPIAYIVNKSSKLHNL